ncbi:MAG TPA: 16S rRNA (cytidine(1402)-2'-O)-methyltransferase [Bacteroidia bacterium]|nr:16S rRNA (cytidine(1402)-2'-O)-methyltransferase [Bacteroidia bacterium]
MQEENKKGKFYVVGTPIGNLSDMTFRAVEILKSVDFILTEDTRVSGKLLKHFEIDKKMYSYNSHASEAKSEKIMEELESGKSIALISDAGTPTISDPGVKIISELREEFQSEIEIIPIPGATALISAISVSGFPASEFIFHGFLPHKKGRETIFKEINDSKRTSVFYESPHRLTKALDSLEKFCGPERKIFVARELTKLYEEKRWDSVEEVKKFFRENEGKVRGEFVICVKGK